MSVSIRTSDLPGDDDSYPVSLASSDPSANTTAISITPQICRGSASFAWVRARMSRDLGSDGGFADGGCGVLEDKRSLGRGEIDRFRVI